MLTARQRLLLKSIIQEFIETAQAVGSLNLSDKYDLDVSPATIRNEMARLAELGLLDKTHSSAGRVPTSRALKWFLEESLEQFEDVDVIAGAAIREELFQRRFNPDKLLQEAVSSLARLTGNTALALLNSRRYISGISRFLDQPEYQDIQRLKRILVILEDYRAFSDLFTKYNDLSDVKVLIGEETEIDEFTESAVAFAPIRLHGRDRGYISVVGPNRMNYARVIPALKYVVHSVESVVEGW
jgi:transcriptional regulator of heat shock response